MRLLGLVGEKASGKDALSAHAIAQHAATVVRYSSLLDRILTELNLPLSRDNNIALATALRGQFGADILGRAALAQVPHDADLVILNGVRYPEELNLIRAHGGCLIAITTSDELRYQRYLERRQKADDGTLNLSDFLKQGQTTTEQHIPHLVTVADHVLENSGDLRHLHQQFDRLLTNL